MKGQSIIVLDLFRIGFIFFLNYAEFASGVYFKAENGAALLSRLTRSAGDPGLINPNEDSYEILNKFSWNEEHLSSLDPAALGLLTQYFEWLAKNAAKKESAEVKTSRHIKRSAFLPPPGRDLNRPRWSYPKLECTRGRGKGGRKCRIKNCGFNSPLDRISYNPNFGCGNKRRN